ncbi:protein kinase domain-containing protein [Micromonospora sp. CA-263727]|uniref:serine/threonine-protein kinase n=1 Tax=Micromonospora sp. CA-263727 TaxID=3239967 RepID=UPI003D8FB41B
MLTSGVVLSERYRLGERVAAGGMGAVWRCTDVLLGRVVAVKVLLPGLTADPEFTARFRAEARMLAALRHPGVVAVHDVGQATLADGGHVDYLVMEYVDGEPLTARLRRVGRLDPVTTMSVVAQTAEALHAAHLAGIVHRDVKPGNLLVKPDGRVVLVDFGIARSGATAGITAAHTVLGTASFMSPEQAAGQPISGASDIYALGAVAYLCLTGRPPFVGDNPLDVALRRLREEPPPLPSDVSAPVASVVSRAMARDPAGRHASAAELANAATAAGRTAAAGSAAPGGSPAPGGPSLVAGHAWAASASPDPGPRPAGAARATVPPAGPTDAGAEATTLGTTTPVGRNRTRRLRRPAVLAAAVGVVLAAVAGVVAVASRPPVDDDAAAAPNDPPVLIGDPGLVASRRAGTGGTGEPRESRSPSAVSTPSPGRSSTPASTPGPGASSPTRPSTAPSSGAAEIPNPYTAVQACGSGYKVINSATLTAGGRRQGRVHLLYHAGTGSNCVVTLKETAVGTATPVSAFLEVQGRARSTDSGSFRYYAGPVRAGAAGTCVKWGGSAGGASHSSPFEHCG